ncbi:non-homologous end-joining DNA ligase LigD [Niabella ginsengisoli]|uniref:DNA ligase D polymerase domain-containing protein n=1 Tax=Niabella ginsengisoli TaxID=522298 RepID=A0ABS9SEQ8_9BACT|nr:hypothetical protein [Niabella ginsengisoli]MCH5596842.1 hypothetical protein [Niabella ginsengisoli]
MNPWNSTTKKQEHPTYMIIDIDPGDNNTFEQVIETALATKQVLDECGVTSFCKTSGASGLHVFVPMFNKYDYEHVKTFAHLTAMKVTELLPDFTTLERNLKKEVPKNICRLFTKSERADYCKRLQRTSQKRSNSFYSA